MIRSVISLIYIICFFSCNSKIDYYHGYIYDMNDNPIEGLTLIGKKNYNNNKITSDEKGRFVIKKEFMTYIFSKPHKYTRPYYSYTMTVKKEGYITDTIDIRKYEEDNNVIMLDPLYLIPK